MGKTTNGDALAAFFKEKGLKRTWFADQIDITPTYLSRIIGNNAIPSRALAIAIEDATDGEINRDEW